MKPIYRLLGAAVLVVSLFCGGVASAQDDTLVFATVDRPPFSMPGPNGGRTGFSIDLMEAIAGALGREIRFETAASFPDMFDAVMSGRADGAIANISITAARERTMDFSQPIFSSGLQIMVPEEDGTGAYIWSLFSRDVAIAVVIALGLLFGGGLLMWVFERKRQPYFDRPLNEALFPSFWWALNLIVNGGFEERMPQSRPGRVLAVVLVISSLFLVSVFVASITASVTVQALNSEVRGLGDLDGQRVGTVFGSTAAEFLEVREIRYDGYDSPAGMLDAFAEGDLDAVFFDAPILAYYTQTDGAGIARLLERDYRPEDYGIAFPTGSGLREDIDQTLLHLRETGEYDALVARWFGGAG
ncbi:transporter substrate-binding domain-containing protein [Rhodobacterales bacterium HKCCE2091]|nr:transporter substrate-binding domain-containing protein [Rhodobacterales bacterium HKCCE2091]